MKKIAFIVPLLAVLAVVIMAFAPVKKKEAPDFKGNFTSPAATKWILDKAHSSIGYSVTHMVVSESEGIFKVVEGSMENTKPDFSDAKISFKVDVNSIDSDSEARDKHLKGEDFFNAAKYPYITFVSTSFKLVKDKTYKLTGNLTMKDVTKPVVFDVTYGGTINTDKGAKAGFKCTTIIDRFDYNLKWSKATEAGGLVVGKDVTITAKVEMNEVK